MPMETPARRPGQTAEPKPAPGVVLIGTRETLAALAAQVGDPSRPRPLGAIIVGDPLTSRPGRTPGWPGLPVLGDLDALADLPVRPRAAVVSLPSSQPLVAARVRQVLADLGIEERFAPPLEDLIDTDADTRSWWRPPSPGIDPAALIGREPHRLDPAAVARVLRGRRVLITGAGGSIGSELARIAATFEPELLILMERAENALFEIDRRLARTGAARRAVLHDVVDEAATRRLIAELRPDVVFHAAAHKHVPLMEDHPAHAVTNNVFGTRAVADAAAAAGCSQFVLISTDKAVHPTSVMGATKRVAEQYVRHLHAARRAAPGAESPTTFSVVRFGNVLGSACSVLPIWAAQLAEGGPITITDPRMTRYFMTIPEAATLVIQAAAQSAAVGEIAEAPLYVLDMGEPVRIVDLAERLIRAHGLEPAFEADGPHSGSGRVDVVFTGIRPGEKLHEELTYAAEPLRPTAHPGIRTFDTGGDPLPDVPALIDTLDGARRADDAAVVLEALHACVPELAGLRLRRAG